MDDMESWARGRTKIDKEIDTQVIKFKYTYTILLGKGDINS